MNNLDRYLNKITCGDCLELLKELPDESIDLVVTSPPYNTGMNYGVNDRKDYKDYLIEMESVLKECYRVLKIGGRIALNLPSCILQATKSRYAYLTLDIVLLMRKVGFLDREWVTWIKKRGGGISGKSTSWGSWKSPSCPYLRDGSEFIIIMSKMSIKKAGNKEKIDITKEEFLEFTTNCWFFAPETNRRHPAPFPIQLPYRLIKLYTYQDDIVLDPFVGSGTSALVALKLNRRFIGFEISQKFVGMAKKRINSYMAQGRIFKATPNSVG